LNWISGKLDKLGIEYMITGGSAVSFWGQVRTTADIDLVINIPPAKVPALSAALKGESYIDEEEVKEAVSRKRMFNAIYMDTAFKVDLAVLDETDAYAREAFSRRKKLEVGGRPLWVISPEDLILSKLRWMKAAGGSERQLEDCRSIAEVSADILDVSYIEKWAEVVGVSKEWRGIKKT